MALEIARFASLLLVALMLAPSAAHLLELPNKIGLGRDDYLVVQRLYRGWALAGIVVVGALLATLGHAWLLRGDGRAFALAAFGCVVATQIVFWSVTFPVNRATRDWTVLPDRWHALRARWEYSHAAGALLGLAALVLTILAVLAAGP